MSSQNEENPLLGELSEIKKWARIQGLEALSNVLGDLDDEELVMYDLATGENSLTDIASHISSGSSTVSNRMQEWSELGIVEKEGRQWKHIAPLSAMGIDRPELDLKGEES